MKNIFKFMGLALVAGSLLFTACKKDENDTTDTTPANPTPANTYTLTWDGQAQELAFAQGLTNGTSLWAFQAARAAEGNSVSFPYFVVYMSGADAASMEIYPDYTEAYIETYYSDGQSNYGDWQYDSTEDLDVTALDATNRTMSAKIAVSMYSLTDYMDSTIAEGAERTTTLAINLNEYEFQLAQ